MKIVRKDLAAEVRRALRHGRVVALVGPRQAGKTTIARGIVPPHSTNYFDLERPADLHRLTDPMSALEGLRGTVVIDEVQHRPELFPILRVLADRTPLPARFLVLGSASPGFLRQTSESLAGRIAVIEISGFSVKDVGMPAHHQHWVRGAFPRSFLAPNELRSRKWRADFVQTFLERDVPLLGINIPPPTLLRFWTMVAHYHGQVWNSAEPARSLGVAESTIRRYLDTLTGVFMLRQLQPWHANLAKRQVKSPKVYVRDSGLLHYLLGINTEADLVRHPKAGSSWEGYVVEQLLQSLQPDQAYFWATHTGAELDLLLMHRGRRYGIEIKRADAPGLTPSMRSALADLDLERLAVFYPGSMRYKIAPKVTAIPASELASIRWSSLG